MLCEPEELPGIVLAQKQGLAVVIKTGLVNTDYLVSITRADTKEKSLKSIFESDPTKKKPAPSERPAPETDRYQLKKDSVPARPQKFDPWAKAK